MESSNHAPGLQGLQNVVVYAPTIETRRQGYALFRKVSLSIFVAPPFSCIFLRDLKEELTKP